MKSSIFSARLWLTPVAFALSASLVLAGFTFIQQVSAHEDPSACNASGLQQFPSVAPAGNVYDGSTLTYTVIYNNIDPDGAGPVAPCNITGADATIERPDGSVINVLTNATLNVGDSISCPGSAGCAAGPYTYAVVHADETANSVTAVFDIDGVLHQDVDEEVASDHDTLSKTVIHPSTITSISASASSVVTGGTVDLTVTEQNDGTVSLTNATVTVDNGVGTLSAPPTSGDDGDSILEVGETWSWTVSDVVINANTTFTATGQGTDPNGNNITWCSDPQSPPASTRCDQDERDTVNVGVANPSTIATISASASSVSAGGTVTLTITEQNDGDVNLTNAHVDVDNGVGTLNASSPNFSGDDADSILEPGETWQWTVDVVVNATITYTATGHGMDPLNNDVTFPADQDEQDAVSITVQGVQYCSPGYWKQSQHFDSWTAPYDPTDAFSSVFSAITIQWSSKGKPGPVANPTLLQALEANGGGINLLARAAVDGLLNAAALNSGHTTAEVIAIVNAAIAAGTTSAYQSAAAQLTAPESCPLN